ncbi:hypothetical protein [Dishui Lake phycodnavirus 3]|nr:hypothetical protein [Dishui Lake phycodnavirus 3]
MFSYDRETMMLVAIVVCLIGSIYVYREVTNARREINDVKLHAAQMAQYLGSLSAREEEYEEEEEEPEEEVKIVKKKIEELPEK